MSELQFRRLWQIFNGLLKDNRDRLNQLDAAIGDADHGTNMCRGLEKAVSDLDRVPLGNLRTDAKTVAMAMLSTVGGASGALWGSGLLKFQLELPEADAVTMRSFVAAVRAFLDAVTTRGGASRGDKTMVDVLEPAIEVLSDADDDYKLEHIKVLAAQAADWAVETGPMVAKKGRASYLGERSIGHIDPGAVSMSLWFQSLYEALSEAE